MDGRAHQRGFDVASEGEASIIAALNEHIQSAMGRKLEIGWALGDLFYRRESNASFDLECFTTSRRLLHTFVVENWPFEKAELVYGAPFPERILHSIGTASKQVGIEPDLLRQLLAEIGAVDPEDDSWEKLQDAKARSGISIGLLIVAIRSGDLQVGSRDGQTGYQSICVLKREVKQLARLSDAPDPQDCISASVFGREVGLRDKGRFLALVDNGHTPATQMRHPRTGVWQNFVTEGDIAAFHERFMTLTSMARKFGRHQRTYLAAWQSADVSPFAPNGEDYGHLYLRQYVEPALRQHQLID